MVDFLGMSIAVGEHRRNEEQTTTNKRAKKKKKKRKRKEEGRRLNEDGRTSGRRTEN